MAEIKKEAKKISKHFSVYMFGTILNKIVSFLMIPIYTSFLKPADYGVMQLLTLSTEVIGMIISAGIASAMFRFYFEYKTESDRNQVISTAMLTFAAMALICLGVVSLFSDFLALKILDSSNYYYYFLITFTSLWLNTNVQMGFTYIRIQEKSTQFLAYSMFKLVLSLSLNIYFVAILQIGVLGILLSTLISSTVFTIILVIPTLIKVKIRFSMKKCKQMLRYGAPLIPTSLAAFVVHSSDRFFIKYYLGLADTGIYSLGYKFGNIPNNFIAAPFMQIWEVRFFKSFKEKNAGKLFGQMFTYLCFLLCFVGLGLSVLIKDTLIIISDSAYWSAYKIVPIIILSYVVFSFQYFFNMGIYFNKKTSYLAYINTSNAILNVTLNFFLIKNYGLWGAAFSTLICFSYKSIITFYISNKLYKIEIEFFRILKLFLAAFIIYLVCYHISLSSVYLNLIIKCFIVLLFPLLIYLLKFLSVDEKRLLKDFIQRRQVHSNV